VVLAHREAAETSDFDVLSAHQGIRHGREDLIDEQLRTRRKELELVGDDGDEVGLGHDLASTLFRDLHKVANQPASILVPQIFQTPIFPPLVLTTQDHRAGLISWGDS